MNDLPFSTLLYRYFFFDWLLRDVRAATDFERGLAVHHNRRAARWLPVYMMRWLRFTLIAWAISGAFEIVFHFPTVAGWFQVASGLGFTMLVVLGTVWVGLTQLSPQKTQ